MNPHEPDAPVSSRGAAELELRVLQLDEAVARVRQSQNRLEQSEEALRRLMQDRGGLLQGVLTIEQLVEVNTRLGRLVEESAQRMEHLEDRISREWSALREQYEEPLRGFKEQANELRLASLEAARSVALSRQIAESSFAAMAARIPMPPPGLATASGGIEPWSLDDVTRVHQEVRAARQAGGIDVADDVGGLPAQPVALDPGATRSTSAGQRTAIVIAVVMLLLGAGAGLVAYTSQMRARINAVDSRMQAAAARLVDAERQTAAAREDADRQIRDAQRTALRAQAIADIIASPDLRRIDLVGRTPAQGAYAQALASQSRGFLLNASRLPAVPEGKTYQVWALSRGNAVSLGVFGPDEGGRGNLLVDGALSIPRLASVVVSLEDSGGAALPTGAIYLAAPPQPPVQSQ
jgi:hypothetical protein